MEMEFLNDTWGDLIDSKIKNQILRFFSTKQMNTRSLGTSCIKETKESLPTVDSSVPLMHHGPSVPGLICLIRKRQILLDFTI